MKRPTEDSLRRLLVGTVLVLGSLLMVVWFVRGGYLWFFPQRLAIVSFEGHLIHSGRELLSSSGLKLDQPLTPRDLAKARKNLTDKPLIDQVVTSWRRGELMVIVKEVLPVSLVKIAGAYYVLLEDGRVVSREVVENRSQVLERLRAVPIVVLSDPLQKDELRLMEAAKQILAVAVLFGKPITKYLRISDQGEFVLELKDGSRIELGQPGEELELKTVRGIEVWRALHGRSPGSPLTIDLATSEGVAYVKLGRS